MAVTHRSSIRGGSISTSRRRSSITPPEKLNFFQRQQKAINKITAQWYTLPQCIVKSLEMVNNNVLQK